MQWPHQSHPHFLKTRQETLSLSPVDAQGEVQPEPGLSQSELCSSKKFSSSEYGKDGKVSAGSESMLTPVRFSRTGPLLPGELEVFLLFTLLEQLAHGSSQHC